MSELPTELRDSKRFLGLGEVLRMALPTSLSMVNMTLMQFVDGLMVAQIRPSGAEALSAQFTGGMLSFVPVTFMLGTLAVVNTFVAQNLGARRFNRCGQYTWGGMYMAWAYSLALIPLMLLARPMFALLEHAPAVQSMEVMYFRYMIALAPVFLSSRVLERFFYGVQKPAVVYVTSLAANGVNLLGDYVLIFGKWGFPRMGLQGAAIATVIGAMTGFLILGAVFLGRSFATTYQTRRSRNFNLSQILQIWRVGWPAGMQFFLDIAGWGMCITLLVGSVSTIGGVYDPDASTIHLAATSVVMRYLRLSFMPAVGIGIATTALVGNYIGAGKLHVVQRRVYAALLLGVAYMGFCGLVFWLARYPMLRYFLSITPPKDAIAAARLDQIVSVGSKVMICAAVFQVFDAFGIVYTGALRGAGDTRWPMMMSGLLAAVFALGGGLFMVNVLPQLESVGVWIAGSAFIISLGVTMSIRFQMGHWKKIDLLET